jgi:hypothetical protein
MTRRRRLQLGIVVLAPLGAWLPVPPAFVERWYATGVYPLLQRVLTAASNVVPFAVFDLLVLGALVGVIALVGRRARAARRERTAAPLLSAAATLCVTAAAIYVAFLLVWGLNYRRTGMSDRLVVSQESPSAEDVVQLGIHAVEQMNQYHAEAHASGWTDEPWRDQDLLAAFRTTQRMLSDARPARPGRLKSSLFGLYFRWASIDGMIDPFVLEVLANPDLLPWERPFVAAHEWAHLAGYAHETEANFVGWLTCVRGDAGARYSGWLHLYWQIAGAVDRGDRARLDEALATGPRQDIQAIIDRIQRGRFPALSNASWVVYEHYLRANRVEEGLRSYGEVVSLILRARFEHGWVPVRRQGDP